MIEILNGEEDKDFIVHGAQLEVQFGPRGEWYLVKISKIRFLDILMNIFWLVNVF